MSNLFNCQMFFCPYFAQRGVTSPSQQQQNQYKPIQQNPNQHNQCQNNCNNNNNGPINLRDYGPAPYVVNINEAAKQNTNFRTALWTGDHLQLTLMSIPVRGEIGQEMHPDVDQFLRLEQGQGIVMMGERQDRLNFQRRVFDDSAIFIPAGTWHNLINTGNVPIKLYSIYAPPNHPRGTVHRTKAESDAAHEHE